jgi:hypothetical protein
MEESEVNTRGQGLLGSGSCNAAAFILGKVYIFGDCFPSRNNSDAEGAGWSRSRTVPHPHIQNPGSVVGNCRIEPRESGGTGTRKRSHRPAEAVEAGASGRDGCNGSGYSVKLPEQSTLSISASSMCPLRPSSPTLAFPFPSAKKPSQIVRQPSLGRTVSHSGVAAHSRPCQR